MFPFLFFNINAHAILKEVCPYRPSGFHNPDFIGSGTHYNIIWNCDKYNCLKEPPGFFAGQVRSHF